MEIAESNTPKIPHCIILPYPIQGHINPMLQFAKRLSHYGIRITLIATKDLSKRTQHQFSSQISVETISDGFDDGGSDAIDLLSYLDIFRRVGSETLSEVIEKLGKEGRPVDCVIYDPFLPWGLEVAKRFGLIAAPFFTQACSVNNIYYHVYKGMLKLPLSGEEVLLPGVPALEFSDMPSFVRDKDAYPGSLDLTVGQFENVEKADFVFVNSIYELEVEVTDWMAKLLPVKTIGPTIPSMYVDKRLPEDKSYGFSIFKPNDACMKWLDEREAKSVIYASFGSMAKLTEEEMEELAEGLKMTDKHFLWVVRSSEQSKLPKNFVEDIAEKGLIVSWCPQLEVLAHDAIGCFLTHCGWNSTLEALNSGLPMVVVPWWSDQSTNAKFVMDVWKMGIRTRPDEKNIVRRDEIVNCVKRVMEGDEGKEVRKNAGKWKELTKKSVDDGGSSDKNIREFVGRLKALP